MAIDYTGIPEHYRNIDITMFPGAKPVYEWIRTGNGFLYIHGPVGTGKTALACAIKRRCIDVCLDCRLIFISDLLFRIKNTFSPDSLERAGDIIFNLSPDPQVTNGVFTIFDDIGAHKMTEHTIDVLHTIIDRRARYNHKTIFTGNYKISELSNLMGDRIGSRIGSGMIFNMSGDDLRIKGIEKRDLTKSF